MPLHWRNVDRTKLKPKFLAAIEALFADSPHTWVVTSGLRTAEEQAAIFGRGRTVGELVAAGFSQADAERHAKPGESRVSNAPPGSSAHNWGCAIDVALDADPAKDGLQADWTPSPGDGWMWLRDKTKGHALLLGGWTFHDWPHIEWKAWRSVRAGSR